jgi:hypothetical protein
MNGNVIGINARRLREAPLFRAVASGQAIYKMIPGCVGSEYDSIHLGYTEKWTKQPAKGR